VGLSTQKVSNLLKVACSDWVRVEPVSCQLVVRYSTTGPLHSMSDAGYRCV